MSAADRYEAAREPKPMASLTRPQVAARIHVLRGALDALWVQSETDGCEPFDCIGSMKRATYWLEERLREMDGGASPRVDPLPLEVALAMVRSA